MLYDIAYKFLSYVMVWGFIYEVLCIRTGILNLVLASTTVSFWYRLLLFYNFINCESSGRHFMPVFAGEKWNYYSARRWKKVENRCFRTLFSYYMRKRFELFISMNRLHSVNSLVSAIKFVWPVTESVHFTSRQNDTAGCRIFRTLPVRLSSPLRYHGFCVGLPLLLPAQKFYSNVCWQWMQINSRFILQL
jgi:hypothetical protein